MAARDDNLEYQVNFRGSWITEEGETILVDSDTFRWVGGLVKNYRLGHTSFDPVVNQIKCNLYFSTGYRTCYIIVDLRGQCSIKWTNGDIWHKYENVAYGCWVTKRGTRYKRWKRRYIVLYHDRTFKYFKNPQRFFTNPPEKFKGRGWFQSGVRVEKHPTGKRNLKGLATVFFGKQQEKGDREWWILFENEADENYWINFAREDENDVEDITTRFSIIAYESDEKGDPSLSLLTMKNQQSLVRVSVHASGANVKVKQITDSTTQAYCWYDAHVLENTNEETYKLKIGKTGEILEDVHIENILYPKDFQMPDWWQSQIDQKNKAKAILRDHQRLPTNDENMELISDILQDELTFLQEDQIFGLLRWWYWGSNSNSSRLPQISKLDYRFPSQESISNMINITPEEAPEEDTPMSKCRRRLSTLQADEEASLEDLFGAVKPENLESGKKLSIDSKLVQNVYEKLDSIGSGDQRLEQISENKMRNEGLVDIYHRTISSVQRTYQQQKTIVQTLDGRKGVLAFLGTIDVQNEGFVDVAGIILHEEYDGESDGRFQGKRYFNCPPNRAIFVPATFIEVLRSSDPEFERESKRLSRSFTNSNSLLPIANSDESPLSLNFNELPQLVEDSVAPFAVNIVAPTVNFKKQLTFSDIPSLPPSLSPAIEESSPVEERLNCPFFTSSESVESMNFMTQTFDDSLAVPSIMEQANNTSIISNSSDTFMHLPSLPVSPDDLPGYISANSESMDDCKTNGGVPNLNKDKSFVLMVEDDSVIAAPSSQNHKKVRLSAFENSKPLCDDSRDRTGTINVSMDGFGDYD